jgi:hypothetical protein
MVRIWLVAGLALGACGKGVDAGTCRERAHELSTLLNTIDHDSPLFRDDGSVHLVVRPDLARTAPGVLVAEVVEVRASDVVFHGQPVLDQVELGARLAAARAKLESNVAAGAYGRYQPDPTLILLVVDEAAPHASVVAAAGAAHAAGFTRPAFVFGRPPAQVAAPPRSWIDDDLDRLMNDDPGQKAFELSRMTDKITKSCPALARAFGAVASDEGADRAQTLIDEIEPALIQCNCTLDIPALRSVMYRVMYVAKPTGLLQVTLAPDGRVLALPATTPWREASSWLPVDGASVWLRVAGG